MSAVELNSGATGVTSTAVIVTAATAPMELIQVSANPVELITIGLGAAQN